MKEQTADPNGVPATLAELLDQLSRACFDNFERHLADTSAGLLRMLAKEHGGLRKDAPLQILLDLASPELVPSRPATVEESYASLVVFELGLSIGKLGLKVLEARKRELFDLMNEKFWTAQYVLKAAALLQDRGLKVSFGLEGKKASTDLKVSGIRTECKERNSESTIHAGSNWNAQEAAKKALSSLFEKAKPQIQSSKKPAAVMFDLDEFRAVADEHAEELRLALAKEMQMRLSRYPQVVGGLLTWRRILVRSGTADEEAIAAPLLVMAFSKGQGPDSLQRKWPVVAIHWIVY